MEDPTPRPIQPLDPTTTPVEPLPGARTHCYSWGPGSFVPLLILIPFVATVIAVWAHSQNRSQLGADEAPTGVYIEQKLERDSHRAYEDRTRDRMKERDEEVLEEQRLSDIVTAEPSEGPLTESALKTSLNQLESRLEILQPRAQESGYGDELKTLRQGYQGLSARISRASDLSDPQQRERFGQEISKLRMRVGQFESDLNDIAVAR